MFELRCTVRNCSHTLAHSENGLTCSAGHHFDRAREGYWNLTQPQDKKSQNPGDNKEAVLARHRWLERGHAGGLVEAIQPWLPDSPQRIVDLGCGDGFFGPALFSEHAAAFCGVDLAKPAIKLAARRWPEATWVLANADRALPVADSSVDCIMSLFGRRPVSEIMRVLAGQGTLIVAVPGEEDLIELREQAQKEGRRRSRIEAIIEELSEAGLQCSDRKTWNTRIEVGADEIADALAMTYRAFRRSERERIASLDRATVTLAADLLLFKRLEP